MFKDRVDAGRQLAEKLIGYKDQENVLILAIPRGGLPLGTIIAKTLKAPLDVALSKKIGHPYNKEYAIGAVNLEGTILNNAVGVTKGYIEEETKRIRKKLKTRYEQYYNDRSPKNVKDKIVIIVDDGIATGNTVKVTAELVINQKAKKVVVAIPVAPKSSLNSLERSSYIDEVICLQTPLNFQAVGQFYKEFPQITDEEAISILRSGID